MKPDAWLTPFFGMGGSSLKHTAEPDGTQTGHFVSTHSARLPGGRAGLAHCMEAAALAAAPTHVSRVPEDLATADVQMLTK